MLRRWLQVLHKKVIAGSPAGRSRTVRRATRRLFVEALEERALPAPVSWINPAGGDWGTPANWSTGAVPGAADDVTINLPGNVTVTHSANATDTVHSLVNADTLQVQFGILNAASFQNSGFVSIAGGAMVAANTYTQTGGQTLLQGGTIGAFLPPENTALAFNGTDQVQVPTSSSLMPTTQLTVEAWVNASSLQNTLQGIAGTWNDINGNNRTNLLWIQSGKFAFYVSHNGSDFPNVVSTTSVQTNQWYHVAGTFDGSNLRLYVNGALEATTFSPGSISANNLPFNIGQVNGGGSSAQHFQGQIADLSFWSVARSQSQIQADMAGGLSGPQTGLAGYWQLAAAPNGTVSDQSGNNNAGTTSSPTLVAAPVVGGTVSIQGGTLSGTGTINGDLTSGGGVDLGGAAGVLTVRGNYTQSAGGTLTLKVGGAAGSQYDQFDVLGTATLGGTLNVVLSNGFDPLHGQPFTVFNFGSESGNFATVNLPVSDGVTAFTTNLNATNLTLVGATIAPTSSVSALPTNSPPSFTVSWSGQDNPGGSGVASFDVYVSDNGGAFVLFVTGTTSTSAVFNGQRGHTYGFYSIATDAIGNREVKAAAAEATTSVPSQVGTTTTLASSASSTTYGQNVTFTATVSAALGVFGTPTGSVQFQVDGANLGSPVALQGVTASLTTSALTAGTHSITAVFTGSTTDFATSTSGALAEAVAPAALLVTVDSKTKVYGAALPAFTGSVSGVVNGDNITASFGTSATAASGVGTYAIVATLNDPNGRLGNYTVTNQPGTLTVTPATLTVTANNASKVYGSPNSTFTATFTGFVNSDTASVVSGVASLTTTATAASGVGTFTITAAKGTLSTANYVFAFANGTLTVTPATLTATANSASKVYGSDNPTFSYTVTGFVNADTASVVSGAASLTTTATAGSGVGAYAISVGQGTLSAANYTFAFVNGTLTVTPAVLTVHANSFVRVFGTPNPTFTDFITGFVNGDTTSVSGAASLTTTATITSHVGVYPIVAGPGTLHAANYTFNFIDGHLIVIPDVDGVALTSSADPSVFGQAVTFTATVGTQSGSVVPTGTVTFLDGANVLATVALDAGTASLTTAALDRGSHAITAVYNGSANVSAGASSVLTQTVETAVLEPDPLVAGKQALFVGGTKGYDRIEIESQKHGQLVEVEIHGAGHFRIDQTFKAASITRVVVYGGPGDNVIEVSDAVKLPAILFGGHGSNYLKGGGGPTVLVGGGTFDVLVGGEGRNILIGGGRYDVLVARGTGTILVGGRTDFDGNATALAALLSEWSRTDESYSVRVSHLLGTSAGGHNGSYDLNAKTVHAAGTHDVLVGNDAMDWFLVDAHDRAIHKRHGEVITRV